MAEAEALDRAAHTLAGNAAATGALDEAQAILRDAARVVTDARQPKRKVRARRES